MTDLRPGKGGETLVSLLRRGLEPRLPPEVRRQALDQIASMSGEDLGSALEDASILDLLRAFDVPFRVPISDEGSSRTLSRSGTGAYGLGADLRRLLNDAFAPTWRSLNQEVEKVVSARERCLALASSAQAGDGDLVAFARGAAWTQLIPGTTLLAIAHVWPSDAARLSCFMKQSLERGGSRAAIPTMLGEATINELSSRPTWSRVYDEVLDWAESWVACASLDGLSGDPQQWLRQLRLQVRIGVARRAADAGIPAPRLVALLELTSAAVLIREAGRADLVRAHRAAGGDPEETVRHHAKHDRRGSVLAELAIAEILRAPDPAVIAELPRAERRALFWFDEVLSADSALASGLLPDHPPIDP
jgi:hypothetical protein